MLRIGVDVRCLSVPITGIGQYTLQLLSRMVGMGHNWFLYSNRNLLPNISFSGKIILRTGSLEWRAAATLWSQSLLPLSLLLDRIDLFWSPRHHLPLLLSSKTKQVVTIHDLVWRHAPQTMRPLGRLMDALLMPKSIRKADGVIAVSRKTADDIKSDIPDVDLGKIRVVYEGVSLPDPLSLSVLKQLGVEKKFILFVGTLEPRKNLKRLLQAYAKLPASLRLLYRLVIVGGRGWGREDIDKIVQELGLGDFVLQTGYVSEEILATLYKYAELLVMPSLYEGFGLPLVEAMSLGTPVLTSRLSSMPEVVRDAAILVDPYDVSDIATGLEKVLVDAKLQARLIHKGLDRARMFDWDRAAMETLSFFEEIMMGSTEC